MNIIIAGNGKVGMTLARQLSVEKHDITLIDSDQQVLNACVENFDVMAVYGNCAAMDVLLEAGVKDADLLIAVAGQDEVNMLCCTIAHSINPQLHTIARIRNPEYAKQVYALRDVFALSMVINPEKQAATEIHRLLKYPGFLHRDTFAKGNAEIVELRIDSTSKLCNVPLSELPDIVKCKVLVCAVLRNGTASAPKGNFVLREADRIFVTAPTENLTIMLKNLGIIARKARRVIICGGGRISYYLCTLLQKDNISTQLIENNYDRCVELASLLPDTGIVHGDATVQSLLESEGLSTCDALITLTGLDELNMVISLYGTTRNVPQVITKLGYSENSSILNDLPLGSIICPKELSCNRIIRYVRAMQSQTGAALSVHTIADGQAEAVEFIVDENTLHKGTPLKSLKLRQDVLIAGITHGPTTEVPNGNSTFCVGDSVIVVTSGRGVLQQLNDIFA